MTETLATDLFHAALTVVLETAGPLLCLMTVTAVLIGVLQAATQVQDVSVSFTPKLFAAVIGLWLGSHWVLRQLESFMHRALSAIPWIVTR